MRQGRVVVVGRVVDVVGFLGFGGVAGFVVGGVGGAVPTSTWLGSIL